MNIYATMVSNAKVRSDSEDGSTAIAGDLVLVELPHNCTLHGGDARELIELRVLCAELRSRIESDGITILNETIETWSLLSRIGATSSRLGDKAERKHTGGEAEASAAGARRWRNTGFSWIWCDEREDFGSVIRLGNGWHRAETVRGSNDFEIVGDAKDFVERHSS